MLFVVDSGVNWDGSLSVSVALTLLECYQSGSSLSERVDDDFQQL